MKIDIYDNGGKTFDRYTLVITFNEWNKDKESFFFGMSENATGFNQFCGTDKDGLKKGPHLGKKVSYLNVSKELQTAIRERIKQ